MSYQRIRRLILFQAHNFAGLGNKLVNHDSTIVFWGIWADFFIMACTDGICVYKHLVCWSIRPPFNAKCYLPMSCHLQVLLGTLFALTSHMPMAHLRSCVYIMNLVFFQVPWPQYMYFVFTPTHLLQHQLSWSPQLHAQLVEQKWHYHFAKMAHLQRSHFRLSRVQL